jgi:hypothetical protein
MIGRIVVRFTVLLGLLLLGQPALAASASAAADVLSPSGNTIAEPGTFNGTQVVGSGGFPFTARVYDARALNGGEPDVCITVLRHRAKL